MIEYFLVAATVLLLITSIWSAGLVPFPTIFVALLALSEVVFVLNHDYSYATFDMLAVISHGGLRHQYTTTLLIYTAMAVLAVLSPIGRHSLLRNMRVNSDTLLTLPTKNYFGVGMYGLLFLLMLHFALFLLSSDWNRLWFSIGYLMPIIDPILSGYLGEGLVGTIYRSLLPIAVLASVGFYASIHLKKPLMGILFAAIGGFYFLVLFSLHSRSAVIVPLFIAATHFVIGRRFRRTVVLLLAFVSIVSLVSALEGRRGYSEQGFASIPSTIGGIFKRDPAESFGSMFVNASEGIFVVAESLQVDRPFSVRYMVLAFSPLPSFLDGYARIREHDEHRLHVFAPMSGIGEVINFGWPFVCLLVALFTIATRLHFRLAEHKPLVFIACNFLLLFSSYYILAYPIRNALRFLWLAILIAVVFGRGRPKRGTKWLMEDGQHSDFPAPGR